MSWKAAQRAAGIALLGALCCVPLANAQVIERNLPPAPQAAPPPLPTPNALSASQDDRPIGPKLTAIYALGPQDAAVEGGAARGGLDLGRIARLDTPAGRAVLAPFLGRPLSRKLIAEVEAAIARLYRAEGFPFVSLSTPPQTIGAGVLQIRVVEFVEGGLKVSGAEGSEARVVRDGVRLQSDQSIDARKLSEDLDWLNRYPFHHVEAVFSPGDALGRTNLDLQVSEARPWQVYAGFANSGSPSTGWERYFFGGQAGGLVGPGSIASLQFTASPDFFDSEGKIFGRPSDPLYVSIGQRDAISLGPRQDIEVSFDHVETNSASAPFSVRQITDELSAGYRAAISNFIPLPGDGLVGVEAKHEQRKTFFAGVDALNNAVEVYQLYAAWSYAEADSLGRSSASVTIHVSPGGLNDRNTSAALSIFTNGRVDSGRYAYVNAQFGRVTHFANHWSLSNTLIGQYAGQALPDTELVGVGGTDLVRGYTLDDGAYDTAIVSRNEIRPPVTSVLGAVGRWSDRLSPFAFLDIAYGSQQTSQRNIEVASTGLGASYSVGARLAINLLGAYAIRDGLQTRSGDWRLQAQASVSF